MIEEVVEELKLYPWIIAVYLFGSQATGKAKPYSDYDICVITEPKITKAQRREILSFSSRKIDISIFWDLPIYIRFRVLSEGKPLFVRDEKKLHRIKARAFKEYWDFKPLLERHLKRVLSNV
ncbi:type VII toxin-antitoxin system MntA family adenylyltransferase antitoxin [Thermococcus barophilus]|uniref:Polymerase beta nucleotidyltransferase domain-containing protein n=2 Tax=Thermococcus barophilus TaxID=55802 RepID=A0A0S1X9U3_THEBA|nr:nucleotidyltransferase domain-containing protein [Thermococcus barophilus]ADT83606.1 hypothetical protein TERMP_00629 [Thermococcus barophilus MP]ALM74512.1 hypothetical protein TBCH5v1_0545 [Thermococcus barophilus]